MWRRLLRLTILMAFLVGTFAAEGVLAAGGPPEGRGGGGPPEGHGPPTVATNNLSFPVIWSDGVTKTLPGVYGAPKLVSPCLTDADGTNWYCQQDPANNWQAQSLDPTKVETPFAVNVSTIDWGDNLESKAWPNTMPLRVETVLYQTLVDGSTLPPMVTFPMKIISGTRTTEMQGTNGLTFAGTEATVYSGNARLTIQRLDAVDTLTWNAPTGEWGTSAADGTFVALPVFFSGGVCGATEGMSTSYAGEINVSGKLVYGYNWDIRGIDPGIYRITFSLDPLTATDGSHPSNELNTFFDSATQVLGLTSEEGGTPTDSPAVVDTADNLTYIDVTITSSQGTGG